MTRFASLFVLTATLAWAHAALAGGASMGAVGQVPSIIGASSRVGIPGLGSVVGSNTYGSINTGVGSGAGVGMNVANSDGVTVQTTINDNRNVQFGSNVTVNETVNGVSVRDLAGNIMAGADAQAQDVWSQKQAYYQQLEGEASMMVQVWQAQGN